MKALPCAAMSRRGVDEGSFFLCNSMFFTSQKATWVQPDSSANSYTTVLLQYPHLIHKTDISVTFFQKIWIVFESDVELFILSDLDWI